MAKIKPFRAVRPRRDLAHLIASRPVSTYRPSILKAKLSENPYTFIHIIHPEYIENKGNKTKPNSIERFKKVRAKYEEFYNKKFFLREKEPALYVYQQEKNGAIFLGVIAGASVEEYKNDLIKKHEATLTTRETMFTNYLDIVGVNAEPVLLCHPPNKAIDKSLEAVTSQRPEYDFTTTDTVRHQLWLVQGDKMNEIIANYSKIEKTYIADGHHRSASSVRLSDQLNKSNVKGENHNYFLSYFISEERLNILPFNRLCKSLNGLSVDQFLAKLTKHFEVQLLEQKSEPKFLHQMHCYIEGSWYELTCKPELLETDDAVSKIDAEILTKYILTPLLGIEDLKTDKNISFISGEKGADAIEQEVNKNVYKVGFSLYPVTVEQLRNVADENAIMPPKSTWIEPKLRSGLTIYTIKE